MLRRRHPLGGIVRRDATDDLALVRLAGHDRRGTRNAAFQGDFSHVEPQAPLALGLIHTVTLCNAPPRSAGRHADSRRGDLPMRLEHRQA